MPLHPLRQANPSCNIDSNKPGQETRVLCEYMRIGVINIFMANEPLKGNGFVEVTETRPKKIGPGL